MSNVLNNVTVPLTNTTGVGHTDQLPGQVGGQDVRVGGGQTLGKRILSAFGAVRDAFVSLKDRISTHFQEKTQRTQEKNATKAANTFVEAFSNGVPSDKKALSLFCELLKTAGKLDPHDPAGKAVDLLHESSKKLTSDQAKALQAFDWQTLGTRVGQVIDTRMERAHNMLVALDKAGMGGSEPVPTQVPVSPLKGQVTTLCANMTNFRQAQLESHFPAGIFIDPQGNLGGTTVQTHLPTDFGVPDEWKGKPFVDFLKFGKEEKLKPENLGTFAGMTVPDNVSGDFFRMDFDIPLSNGAHFKSSEDPTDGVTNPIQRSTNALHALRDFCGDDESTKVFSSLLAQTTLHPLARGGLTKPDGTMTHLKIATAQNTVGEQFTLKDVSGNLQNVDDIVGIGGAKWNLSKEPNGDFKVSVDWQAYYMPDPNHPDELPLHDNGLIGVRYQIDFVVDHAKARNGELSFTMPNGVMATFSGGLTL